MKVEKIKEIKAPGDGILSVSFQPHPIGEKWDKERVAICGEKGVHIWLFEYNGKHKKLAFIESSTSALIKMCRWSQDGKYLAIVDMEQIAIYYKGSGCCSGTPRNLNVGGFETEGEDKELNELFENWTVYVTFSSSDVNECADICWLKGSRVLVNGTISGHLIVYNMEERCQSSNLFIRDIVETGMRNRNMPILHTEIGHVSGLCSDARGFFLASQMSSRRLLIFNVEYNKENGKETLTKRNCITLSFLIEEERLIINSPCILTFIRRPVFDPLTCLIGCPYGEVGTSYFSCLFPFRDISDTKPFGWEELCKLLNYELEGGESIKSDIWNLHNEGKTSIKGKLELPEAYRLRGHQRRVRIFQFSSTVIKEKDEIFSLCAQSSQDGSLSFWKVIYDLKSKSKIKSIECFLVLTNFMDEQASVTDISFNNFNNSVLIGSDDNKLTLISFEFEEFSLAKTSSKDSSEFYYSNWNYWNFEFIPEKPSLQSMEIKSSGEPNLFSKHLSLPVITANEIREHQERTQEAVIGSKGTKIRRIQPLNLTEMYVNKSDGKNEINDNAVSSNISITQEDQIIGKNINQNQGTSKKFKKNQEIKENNTNEIKVASNDQNRDIDGQFEKNSENQNIIHSSIKENNTQMNFHLPEHQNNQFIKEWRDSVIIPPRLAIETNIIMNQKNYKMAVFADNRQIIENINRNRYSSTEIICMRQETLQENEISNVSKEMLWYKPISNNNVVTHMIRIKDILLVIYSDILERKDIIASSNLEFLNFNTGSTLIGVISLPFVLKVVLSESLDMILLVTINGKIKIFQIHGSLNDYESSPSFLPNTSTCFSSGFSINWVLDADWSFLSSHKLSRVDFYSSHKVNQLKEKTDDPIIILYFDDGKTFSYSFNISSFVRIDDLEHCRSDFWSMVFPKTYMQILQKSHHHFQKAKLLELVSEAVSAEHPKSEIEISSVCLDPRGWFDTDSKFQVQECFFLREIQQNSRQILLNHQHSQKVNHLIQQKMQSIFENILSTSLFDDYNEEDEPENSYQDKMDDSSHFQKPQFEVETKATQDNSHIIKSSSKDHNFDEKSKAKVINEDLNGNVPHTKMHIEHQLVSSIIVKSRSEFKYWFKIYIKFLLDSFDQECIKEVTNRALSLVKESILTNKNQNQLQGQNHGQNQSNRGLVAPTWFNLTMLESIDVDPARILIDDIISGINDFISLLKNSKGTLQRVFSRGVKSQVSIEQFLCELENIKEKIASQVKSIQEEFETYKNIMLNNSQCLNSSQNSDINYSSRLGFLNSIFS
ncbi:histone transcription regulator-like WD40 repeat-containing protein [Cryptosporidium ubiquitum]|uniref:Histone transcription regulator-like WD40 repeat-containing protein n=1 Tax=Cryptosporidium ubiquitum TaxID=857276 RepID=A0A1J4MJG1_9CRYT|nr:histone transcription regulator-like WD40 repeat-containing protein [Cryptosporidium ubiquitum]OII74368.1 histone transcription regulator-like WD40 repeat-containing protein [Cryptosporidium ubiquitum]